MITAKRRLVVGVIDYGVGNIASVCSAFDAIGLRCRVSREPRELDETDVIVLPGVGAFPYAMAALLRYELCDYIRSQADKGKPVLGICLGMHLLAEVSDELQVTAGLGLIPGSVGELEDSKTHVGWNTIKVLRKDGSPIKACDGEAMYFNHSYVVNVVEKFQLATAQIDSTQSSFVVALKRENIVGVQCHPEKSQRVGRLLLSEIIKDLYNA